jgi:ADP-ribose pyrophosphatase YjhB (NUDIX family)
MTTHPDQTEQAFLANYNPRDYASPLTTVDMAIFSLRGGKLHVLLVQRAEHPCKTLWALPGGFIDLQQDQVLDDAAQRKLLQKTGVGDAYLEQVASFGGKQRDPRGWSLTILYYALIDATGVELRADQSATAVQWFALGEAQQLQLAFDHQQLLAAAHERLKAKVEYTALPVYLMPEEFTLGELQLVFEAILQKPLEKKSFRRRMHEADLLEDTANMRRAGARPAQLYRLKGGDGEHIFARSLQGKRSTGESNAG